jgi:hypothetical protein
MEFDGLCLGYPKMIAYGVTNLGRYTLTPSHSQHHKEEEHTSLELEHHFKGLRPL